MSYSKEQYNCNPIHDINDIVGDKQLRPATKIWRKAFKVMIKRAKNVVAESKHALTSRVSLSGMPACGSEQMYELEQIEVKILTYAFYYDTRNAVLQMKKYKKICQEITADLLDDDNFTFGVVYADDDCNFVKEEFLKGEAGFKIITERMQSDIEFYESICYILIADSININRSVQFH